MKLIKWSLLVVSLLFVLSCEEIINPGDVVVKFSNSNEDFVWSDQDSEIKVTAEATEVENLDKIVFFVNGEEVFEDNWEPFEYTWDTTGLANEQYRIRATGHYGDQTSTVIEEVKLSPCPILQIDTDNIIGITETDDAGNIIGNIDESDWHFERSISFGPAYPNPAVYESKIPFRIYEEEIVTIIVINNDNELFVLKNNEVTQQGTHEVTFILPTNTSDIYRVIFHVDDENHWYGDILDETQ